MNIQQIREKLDPVMMDLCVTPFRNKNAQSCLLGESTLRWLISKINADHHTKLNYRNELSKFIFDNFGEIALQQYVVYINKLDPQGIIRLNYTSKILNKEVIISCDNLFQFE